MRTVIEIMRVPCQKKGIDLELAISDKVPQQLYIDIQRVRQVFLNLLQNAIKFTYEGKIVAELDYEQDTHYITARVRDSGVGISEED